MATTTIVQTQSSPWPWLMLPARLVLFGFWQFIIAVLLRLLGTADPWLASAAWWPLSAFLANLICIGWLDRLYRWEGLRFWDIFRIQRQTMKQDLLIVLGAFILAGPIAFLPNILAATWLFGEQQDALDLFMQPLPSWGFVLGLVLFPMTMALAELPTYFAYCMPRLETQTGRRWLAVLLPALFLALQHCTLPLIFDGRFIAWRLLMYLPFAIFIGLLLRWRPQLLPYLVVEHFLLDMATAFMIPLAG